jgi:hypothetical protein
VKSIKVQVGANSKEKELAKNKNELNSNKEGSTFVEETKWSFFVFVREFLFENG